MLEAFVVAKQGKGSRRQQAIRCFCEIKVWIGIGDHLPGSLTHNHLF